MGKLSTYEDTFYSTYILWNYMNLHEAVNFE